MPWHDIAAGAELPVRGGIRALQMQRCVDRPMVCPDRRRGRCQRWHASWAPREMRLDDLIVRAAGQDYQPVHVPTSRGSGNWFWVRAADKATYLFSLTYQPSDHDTHKRADTRAGVTPKPLSRTCTYGQNSGLRADAAPTRDTGAVIEAPTLTVSNPEALRAPTPGTETTTTANDISTSSALDACHPTSLTNPADATATQGLNTAAEQQEWFPIGCGHIWPATVDLDAVSQSCGLEYSEYDDFPM